MKLGIKVIIMLNQRKGNELAECFEMVATGGFEPPTNALLQHWSTSVTYYNY